MPKQDPRLAPPGYVRPDHGQLFLAFQSGEPTVLEWVWRAILTPATGRSAAVAEAAERLATSTDPEAEARAVIDTFLAKDRLPRGDAAPDTAEEVAGVGVDDDHDPSPRPPAPVGEPGPVKQPPSGDRRSVDEVSTACAVLAESVLVSSKLREIVQGAAVDLRLVAARSQDASLRAGLTAAAEKLSRACKAAGTGPLPDAGLVFRRPPSEEEKAIAAGAGPDEVAVMVEAGREWDELSRRRLVRLDRAAYVRSRVSRWKEQSQR